MAQKAVLITAGNIKKLTSRFQDGGTGVDLAIGYYLLADFGEDSHYEVISAATLHQNYEIGQKLHNKEFFEVIKK